MTRAFLWVLGGLYVRAKRDGQRVFGPFPSLPADHPLIDGACAACGEPFRAGQRSSLVALGPDNAEDRAKWLAGGWCSVVAAPLHADCAGAVEEAKS